MKIETETFTLDTETTPLFRKDEQATVFPFEALGELRDIVAAVATITQAPIEIAAQSTLAVIALLSQTEVDVETLQGTTAPTSLFFLTIAASGERKSSCDKLITQGVVSREIEKERAFKSDMEAYEFDLMMYRAAMKKAKSREDLPDKPKRPIDPMRLVGDPTLEGLIKAYITGQPSVLLLSDEGGTLLGGYSMNKDNRLKTLSGFSKLWDGSAINRTRGGDGVETLRGRRLSLHLMAQPMVAESLLSDRLAVDQGFLSRTLISQPQSLIGTRFYKQAPDMCFAMVNAFADKVRSLSHWEPRKGFADRLVLEPRTLQLAPLSREFIRKFYDEIEAAQSDGQRYSEIKGFASKIVEMALRLAGVLTYWRDRDAEELDIKAVEDGITLARYYLEEARRLINRSVVSIETKDAALLLDWLQASWSHEHIIPAEIVQNGPNKLRETKRIKPLIEMLVESGYLLRLDPNAVIRGKERKEAYYIVRE